MALMYCSNVCLPSAAATSAVERRLTGHRYMYRGLPSIKSRTVLPGLLEELGYHGDSRTAQTVHTPTRPSRPSVRTHC